MRDCQKSHTVTRKERAVALTDTAVKKAKPGDKPYKMADEKGLYLLVNQAGKYWRMDYRFLGKRKTLALGVYSDVSLARARQKRDDARAMLADGTDPGEQRKETKRANQAAQANSFEAVAREWHAMKLKRKWTQSTADKTMAQLEAYVFPEMGHLPIASVKASQLLAMLRKVENRGIAYTAVRLREVCGQIFRYGVATGRAEDNPAAHLLGALHKPEVNHRPAITDRRGFGAFLRDLREATGYDAVTRHAAYFALLTFVRAQEFRYAKWEEIDWQAKEWKVPAKRMKTGKALPAHTVPLSQQALALLTELKNLTGHSPYLFPKVKGYGDAEVISENTVGKMLNKMGYQGRQCVHGFRASARSILSEQGWSREAMERQLDHKETDSTVAAYARSEHLPERRNMMQAWADTCDALETGAEIILLPRTA
ncbi:probable cp4-like integrase protein [Thiobacillus denitrificans ATCC 25259]|uniref:Probable cp4-like integrase protein n=1 Tax=Thiobacillus denitrificans (strain ATCC 25259 / T1) TaxID=292415 RepID=Q3SHC8_THIDA|nr:probable cp4-like integrase protein [Thiobacillus denitrificans ATCC 25259]